MKAEDVVTQLQVLLPTLVDDFTTDISVASLTRSGTKITAACNQAHSLKVGDPIVITGAVAPIPITTLTRSGTIGTAVTSTDHDLTEPIAPTIEIVDADDAEFNGTFVRLQVKNRRTITFTMVDAGPTSSANASLNNAESALRSYNGAFQITSTPGNNIFTFEHSVTSLPNPTGTIVAKGNARISASVTIERAMTAYTKMSKPDKYLFVVLEDATASKSRNEQSDAIDNLQPGEEFRQLILQPVTLYVFFPVIDERAARLSRDDASVLFRSICRSILGSKFSSGLHADKLNSVQFLGHGVFRYDTSTYIHAYSFEVVEELYFEDTVGFDLDVAFRDMDLTLFPDAQGGGTLASFLTALIDLDDEPLP